MADLIQNKSNSRFRNQRMTLSQAFALNNNMVPPQAEELEEEVLGALLLDQDALTNTIDRLRVEFFYKEEHQEIFSTILALFQEGNPIDLITVTEKLKKRGSLEAIGGSYKMASLTSKVTSAAHIEYYVSILAEKFIQRELIRVSTETLKDAYDETTDIVDLLDRTETKFLDINDKNFNSSSQNMQQLIHNAIGELELIQNSDSTTSGLQSGFEELDRCINGFQPGTLIILAARPAMGKTAFAVSMARNIAVMFHQPIAIFSLEMTAMELTMRLISSEVEIEGSKLKRGDQMTTQQINIIKERTQVLSEAPIFIDDNPGLSIFDLRAKCRRLKQAHDIKMVFIDYLQLMSGGESRNNGNREQEISFISRQLKALSKELGIPILALSQLSRAVETRGGSKTPVLSDLRESGAIEQDADIVMFIYRPEYYNITEDENGSTQGVAYIDIAKNRAGSTAKARLGFKHQFVKFYNIGKEYSSTSPYSLIPENAAFDSSTNTATFESQINNEMEADNDENPF
ncbi:MAG: replicative DNA helicase [Bacteroidales bacterium]|nr:replicative DNA helicase [Bacteroidales bacterium]MDY6403386.1 replicative DNA helicase [Bacteroidales bacterium]MDY6423456.1 replicative DNA helicase [Bacteroidales bacterium]